VRRIVAALAVTIVAAAIAGFAPPASAANITYVEPVTGTVVDPFRPPSTPYGRGNRGLTYATVAGAPVRASAPGRVTFAGQVGGALHVVVQHGDGVRTSYSFLRAVAVHTGNRVDAGHVVGTSGSTFHFGARIGDAYIDPAILLASGPARVHLIPDGEFREIGAEDDHKALLAAAADFLGSVTSSAVAWARDTGEGVARELAEHFVTVLDEIVDLGQFAGPFASLSAALADILEAFIEPCTPAEVAPAPPTERRIAVFVAGLGSHSGGPGSATNLSKRMDAAAFGYAPADVVDFSYAGGRRPGAYEAADTVRDLRHDAADLRELLDQIALDHPGVPVDLIGHSQGGLIAREALAERYDGPGHALPPIAHVVTVGTPHHGTDAATAAAWLRWSRGGQAVRELARLFHTSFDLTGPGVAQLSETSDFIESLNDRRLREGVAYTSIAAADDLVVPAPRARLRGARNVLVDPTGGPAQAHTALEDAPSARREIALALADSPPTCQSLFTTSMRAFAGVGIAEIEDRIGSGLAVAGAL